MKTTVAWIPVLLCALALPGLAKRSRTPAAASVPPPAEAPAAREAASVLHYTFSPSAKSACVRDRSGAGNDGMAVRPLRRVPGIGKGKWAAYFDGVGDYIRVPRSPSLEPESVTVAAWLKLDAARPMSKPGGTIVFKRNPSFHNNEDYHLEIRRDGTVHATCANPAGVQTTAASPAAIAPGIWHHVAMSVGGGRIRLYVDGEPVATTPCPHPLNHNPEADLFIGAKDHVQFPMDHPCPMELAEVRIWAAALSDAEIAALYRGKARFPGVARPDAARARGPARVFPPWQPPAKDGLAEELRLLLEQGRRDRAASPEFLDALQRLLERHGGVGAEGAGEGDCQ